MITKKAPAALAILAMAAVLLTGCSDDGQTDQNPCGDTGKPSTGSIGVLDATRSAFVTKGGGGGVGGKSGSSSSSGGSKTGTSSGSKTSSGGSSVPLFGNSSTTKSSAAATGFKGSTVTGSRTFTGANGTKYAVAPRLNPLPRTSPHYVAPPTMMMSPGMHYPWMLWAIYGNYPGATTVIHCR
jgi:hypothetical protein